MEKGIRSAWLAVLLFAFACSTSGGALHSGETEDVTGDLSGSDLFAQGDYQPPPQQTPDEPLNTENSMSGDKNQMASYYVALNVDANPAIEPYALPLAAEDVSNFDLVVSLLGLEDKTGKLLANGFVVVPFGDVEDIAEPYATLKELDVPFFVTVDTWLHLYHVQFDELLMTLEEELFYDDIVAVTDALLAEAKALYDESEGLLREAAQRNVAFLSVARQLFVIEDEPDSVPAEPIPDYVADIVAQELELVDKHIGFSNSPLFTYKEDYSQYVPRGHYTRSERLKSYFKGMMWYGRLTMLLKGGQPACEYNDCPALVLPEEADIQTVQAFLLTLDMRDTSVGDETAFAAWERIYQATSFFVGVADDLSYYEFLDTLVKVVGEAPALAAIVDEDNLFAMRADLALKRSPQIYGGTGGQVIIVESSDAITPDMLEELLEKSKGFRLMGQRFIPDSYVMGRLVSPGAGGLAEDGDPNAFTAVLSDVGYIRGFPRGLDVMAVMGSERASWWLSELKDDRYTKYAESFADMTDFLAEQTPAQWHVNLYWGWLDAIRTLLEPAPEGTQTFMQTDAWLDKSLTTALASWSELRHDTILYAKQSYTPDFDTSVPPPAAPGYVEPNPAFYASLLALNEMTRVGLDDMGLLPPAAEARLVALSTVLGRMLDISLVEISGAPLDDADVAYIDFLADTLDTVVAGVEEAGVKTTLVADVHTDQNSKKVLEEGVGYVELLVAAYRLPDGTIALGAGPVLSHYEFKHPMDDRLTDEKWREILTGTEPGMPAAPQWTATYRVE